MVQVTLNPSKDAFVKENDPNATDGSATTLLIGWNTGTQMHGYLAFDLSSIPAGARIDAASLRLYQSAASGGDAQTFTGHKVLGSWGETTVTWNNKPSVAASAASLSLNTSNGWRSWNIKSIVEAWIESGETNHGFAVRGATGGFFTNSRTFYSRTGANPPELIVDYTPNDPPDAPTLVNPAAGQTIDASSTERFDWDFSDPDAGDSQSAFDLQIRLQGETDLVVDVADEATPNTYYDVAGGTLAEGDYEWRVRTKDAQGEVGPWASWSAFSASVPPDPPTITAPTSGATISTESDSVTWSAPEQAAYQLRRIADDAGTPDDTTVYFDTGTVEAPAARTRTVDFDTNDQWEWIQVRIRRIGLWSDWAEIRVHVSYTPPATPTAAVAVHQVDGLDSALEVSATHPSPDVGEPAVTAMDVHRRVAADGGVGIRLAADLAPSATFTDWTAASGVAYEYRVRAVGDNGTSSYSDWTA